MVELTINLPDKLAFALGDTSEARVRRLKEHAAIEEYRSGRLSHREVGESLGLDYWATEEFLSNRGVAINYTTADLDADRETLAIVLRDK